jgi:hypothetical protein
VIPVAEGMSVDALTLMYGAEQIGLENFYYQMKGRWGIGRCVIADLPPIGSGIILTARQLLPHFSYNGNTWRVRQRIFKALCSQ